MKRIAQLENDMNTVASQLAVSGEKLEAANKKNSEVIFKQFYDFGFYLILKLLFVSIRSRATCLSCRRKCKSAKRAWTKPRSVSI